MDKTADSLLPARQERFRYVCHQCLRCCHDKKIQLNPYEVARLARNRGQTTTQFRAEWTVDGAGTVLQQTETGACVFLGAGGCMVHADRPLVGVADAVGADQIDQGHAEALGDAD